MPDIILDGRGKGNFRAGVNEENQLLTLSTTIAHQHFSAHRKRTFFTIVRQTPSAPNTPFLYIKNNSVLHDMTIWSVRFKVNSVETIEMHGPIVGTVSGSTVTPVNVYIGSGVVADATTLSANALTGITSSGTLIRRYSVPADNLTHEFQLMSGIIIPQGTAIAYYAVSGSIQIDIDITLDFHLPL